MVMHWNWHCFAPRGQEEAEAVKLCNGIER